MISSSNTSEGGKKRSQERIGLGDTGDCIAAWPKIR